MGARLAELEPHLVEVETRIRQLMPGPGFCSTAARYGESGHSWKREMMAHVGDRDPSSDALDRRRPDRDEVTDRLLRTDRAYDVAYDRLVGLLPRHWSGCNWNFCEGIGRSRTSGVGSRWQQFWQLTSTVGHVVTLGRWT